MMDKIKDKVQLVIEETGCDAEQAGLVLNSTNYDIEKAIKVINSLLKQIVVIKGKFICEETNLYGLFIIITDIKIKRILRSANIITYNPSIYQTDLNKGWHEFERKLYALRLSEGCLRELTHKLQQQFQNWIYTDKQNIFLQFLLSKDKEALEAIFLKEIKESTQEAKVILDFTSEEVNLFQFKELKEQIEDELPNINLTANQKDTSEPIVSLKIELVKDEQGASIKNFKKGTMTWVKIVDTRDIAQYLAKLLGGRRTVGEESQIVALAVPIEEVSIQENKALVKVRFGPAILGETETDAEDKIKVAEKKEKIFAWLKIKTPVYFILITLFLLLVWWWMRK